MNEPKPQPPQKPQGQAQPSAGSEPETTVLHLGKFLADAAADRPEAESPTMLIRKAAAQAAAQQPVTSPRRSRLSPERMLGVLAYAYVKGVYRSEDIERKMRQDPQFNAALGGEVPTPQTIRCFRRLNRQAILAALGKFFRWRRSRATPQPSATGQPDPEPSTQYYVKHEAEDVLNRAIWVDNMSKDE
jgi:hypothetical protein